MSDGGTGRPVWSKRIGTMPDKWGNEIPPEQSRTENEPSRQILEQLLNQMQKRKQLGNFKKTKSRYQKWMLLPLSRSSYTIKLNWPPTWLPWSQDKQGGVWEPRQCVIFRSGLVPVKPVGALVNLVWLVVTSWCTVNLVWQLVVFNHKLLCMDYFSYFWNWFNQFDPVVGVPRCTCHRGHPRSKDATAIPHANTPHHHHKY